MPHAIVKLYAGRSEEQKAKLAEEVTKAIMSGANCPEDAVSVSIEDIEPSDWTEKVYKPDIAGNFARLYKKPGYDPR
jgi:4-oxalocrotonate tautomerase